MYIVSLNYKVPAKVIAQFQEEHTAFLQEQVNAGAFIITGARELKIGEILIANTKTKEALENILEKDPFKKNAVADYKIMEVTPTMAGKKLSFLIEQQA
jgi:uncharacterized protein YciI